MEDNRTEQKEALETLVEFNERLLKNMNIAVKELSGERLDDTDKFVKSIIDAINWEIGVMNGTLSLLNKDKERVNKEQFNRKVMAFADAVNAKDDAKMADAMKELIPEFEGLGIASKEVFCN